MEYIRIESITFTQAPDTCSDENEIQTITIEFLNNGLEDFWKIKSAENWAVSPEEAVKLIEKLNKIAEDNTKAIDKWIR